MSATDWVVIAAGVSAIVWVNWYFFLAERSIAVATVRPVLTADTSAASRATAEVAIAVHGGYDPATIRVTAGQPVRLVFERQDTSSCSEEIVLADFGIRRFLPTGQKVAIEITPPRPGRYEFQCGMGMLHGVLIAEEAGA